jgi:hypothetical protein
MKIELIIPDYSPSDGIRTDWEEAFILKTEVAENGAVRIMGNQNGLISLARHILTLAQPSIPAGYHLHYDTWNSLEEGSPEIIIEKI